MKILITGGNGYIAKSIYSALKDKYDITCIDRTDVELTSFSEVNRFFNQKYFDVVIHTAVKGGSRLKKETWQDADCNVMMYHNLLNHKNNYGKLIHFGSGAEKNCPDSPYSLSKRLIANSIREQENFYNIRIYAVFDENELDTRFIKNNLINYVAGNSLTVFKDMKMDFFYMPDLLKIVDRYINKKDMPKEIDCCYEKSFKLSEIANMINSLDSHSVPIVFLEDGKSSPYCGKFTDLGIKFVGIRKGIREVFNKISQKNEA